MAVHYPRYWSGRQNGKFFCPVDAYPDTAASLHREANGLVADQI